MAKLTILVGLPGSGKSTWRDKHQQDEVIISSDDEVEKFAASLNMTYTEAWPQVNHKIIRKTLNERFEQAVRDDKDIIVDMTNMGKKARRSWINKASGYEKIAIVFNVDDNELRRRLDERKELTGKEIPDHVLESMSQRFEMPTKDEGFSSIETINT